MILKKWLHLILAFCFFSGIIFAENPKDKSNFSSTERYIKQIDKYLDMGDTERAEKNYEYALMTFGRISDEGQSYERGLEIKKKFTEAEDKLKNQGNADQATAEKNRALKIEEGIYNKYTDKWDGMLSYLSKADSINVSSEYAQEKELRNLDKIMEQFDDFVASEEQLRKDIPIMISENPNMYIRSFTVPQVMEILENAQTLRNNLVDRVCMANLNEKKSQIDINLNDLTDFDDSIDISWLSAIYGENKNKPYTITEDVKPYYNWIGKPVPTITKDINNSKETMRKAYEKVAANTKFDTSKFKYQTSGMKEALENWTKHKIIDYGAEREGLWTVVKNEYGIPLYQAGEGFVILRNSDEPFNRAYKVVYNAHYNGVSYNEVSSVGFQSGSSNRLINP